MTSRLWNIYAFLFLPLLAFCQESPRIINFSKADYNAQSQNWAITQSDDGTLFFANNGGLLEYDGARWRSFRLPESQIIRTLAWHKGRIYAGGFAEFGYFEHDSKVKWRYQSLCADLYSDRAHREEIWNILIHPRNSQIYFQSFSTIYKSDGTLTTELIPPVNIMFMQRVGQRVFFPGIDKGLYELQPQDGFRFFEGSEVLSRSTVSFILPLSKSEFLAGTNNAGIFKCDDTGCRPWDSAINSAVRDLQPNKAVMLNGGRIGIGTILGGVFIATYSGELLYHFDMNSGLQNNTVLSMFSDKSGNLWVGLDKGIDLIELNSPLAWFIDHSGKLGSTYTAALFEDHLYLGTNQGVFYKTWKSYPTNNLTSKGDSPFRLVPGTQGQVWQLFVVDQQLLCGHNEGTYIIDKGIASKISNINGGWLTLPIPGKEDVLIQGTYTGLIILKKRLDGKWHFSHRVRGLTMPIRRIAFDESGALWIVHANRGLWKVRLNENLDDLSELKQFGVDDGLSKDFRLNLIQTSGNLLVKSDIEILKIKDGRLHPYKMPNEQITEFDFGTEGRIAVYPQKSVFSNSSVLQEFPLSLFPDYEKIVQIQKGIFLFCLENGYALWRKREGRDAKKEVSNRVRITQVETLTEVPELFFPGTSNDIWKLAAHHNNLRFYSNQPYFSRTNKLYWQLEGPVNRSWHSDQNQTELTNLPPGNYTISIGQYEGSSHERVHFEILKPWWMTWWASLIWLVLAAVILFLIERYNHHRLKRQKIRLENEKKRELEEQKIKVERERLQEILANRNRELSNATINLIRKNETLLEIRTELENQAFDKRGKGRLDRIIENHISADQDWHLFEEAFNQVHDEFFKKLKNQYPDLTTGDLRLAAFLKINLSSKEISSLLGLSVRGVENKRYRLRKKLGLNENDNLTSFMIEV